MERKISIPKPAGTQGIWLIIETKKDNKLARFSTFLGTQVHHMVQFFQLDNETESCYYESFVFGEHSLQLLMTGGDEAVFQFLEAKLEEELNNY
jgi:hypothetical protein